MNPTDVSGVPWAIPEGIASAVVIALCAFVLSHRVGLRVSALERRKGENTGVGTFYAMTITRLWVAVAGILGVFLVLGPGWGIPCALCAIPLYTIIMVCGARSLAKRREKPGILEPNTSNEAESKS